MNYKKHYELLIKRSIDRHNKGYVESHHIIPKCIGGTNEKDNLVDLTAREHFVAHILLVKIYPNEFGLIKAVNMMCVIGENQDRSMNRMYGWLKEKFSIEMSRKQIGDGNSQFGSMWIHNLELRKSKKIPKGEDIPKGWLKGRKISFIDKVSNCKECDTSYILKTKEVYCSDECKHSKDIRAKVDTLELLKQYLNSECDTLNSFSKNLTISVVSLTKRFKKHIDGYTDVSFQGAHSIKDKLRQLL